MRSPPAPENATIADLAEYVHQLHNCMDDQHEDMKRRVTFDGNFNILGVITILITIVAFGWGAANWTSGVNFKLEAIPILAEAGRQRDIRLNQLEDDIMALTVTVDANQGGLKPARPNGQ
jgi:hypothetical protein